MGLPTFSGVAYVAGPGALGRDRTGGFAVRERRLPWSRRVRTQVGSISKQFVAAVALLLAESGDIQLDRAVTDAWPELSAHWRRVTLRQMLSHMAGVPHWHDAPGYRIEQPLDVGERVERLVAADLSTEPGTEWLYSSPGYLIAASLIERMVGSPYGELVDRLILQPLGLTDTRSGQPLGPADAHGYDGPEPAPLWDLHLIPGTGDITSTAADIATFLRALNEGDLVATGPGSDFDAGVQLPADSATTTGPVRTTAYAAGHFVGTVNGREATICPGDNPGFKALGAWLPDTGETVVALVNDEADDAGTAVAQVLESGVA